MHLETLLPFSDKLSAIAALLSGVSGFMLSQSFVSTSTYPWLVSVGIGVFSSLGGAALAVIPRVIDARTESRFRDAQIKQQLWRQADDFKATQIRFFESRLASKDLVVSLERRSKHRALSECQRLLFHINFLEGLVVAKGIEFPTLPKVTFESLIGEADREIEAEAAKRARDTNLLAVQETELAPKNKL
jgi:hypothetical protein